MGHEYAGITKSPVETKNYQASETFSASKRATGGQLAKVISNNVLRNPKRNTSFNG